ncbi:MAG: rRNA maturation RNase YbeY [Spirochaetaceae bacterium]|jgi:probable rRNA maturation factor|nr:rRNA maturation RNase YbeY [Spirochaetaceae bacterium]
MNRVEISLEGVEPPLWLEDAAAFAEAALKKLGKNNWELSLLFCSDEVIRSLNRQYRNRDEATDVLSFTLGESAGERFLPGDIVISLETVTENALRFNVPPGEELRRLLLHGILHLGGMDHASNGREEPMLALQEKLLAEISAGFPWEFSPELPAGPIITGKEDR